MEEEFFKLLGKRIAGLRVQSGLSQRALAKKLNATQQAVATYELGTRRVPSSLLVPLCQIFEVSLEQLLDAEPIKLKPGPVAKLHKQVDQVSKLPRSKQKFVSDFIDTILQGA